MENSAAPPADFSVDATDSIIKLVGSLLIERYILVGHSRPDREPGLALIDLASPPASR